MDELEQNQEGCIGRGLGRSEGSKVTKDQSAWGEEGKGVTKREMEEVMY